MTAYTYTDADIAHMHAAFILGLQLPGVRAVGWDESDFRIYTTLPHIVSLALENCRGINVEILEVE